MLLHRNNCAEFRIQFMHYCPASHCSHTFIEFCHASLSSIHQMVQIFSAHTPMYANVLHHSLALQSKSFLYRLFQLKVIIQWIYWYSLFLRLVRARRYNSSVCFYFSFLLLCFCFLGLSGPAFVCFREFGFGRVVVPCCFFLKFKSCVCKCILNI